MKFLIKKLLDNYILKEEMISDIENNEENTSVFENTIVTLIAKDY